VAAVSRPPCIEPKARKDEYFGLETEPTSIRQSQLEFQVSLSGTDRALASPMQAADLHTRGLGLQSPPPPGASIPQ